MNDKVKFKGQFYLLCMQYISPVLHLLLPIRQAFASLLLLSEGFLGLCTEIHVVNDFADLFASFGGSFTVTQLLVCVLFIALLEHRKIRHRRLVGQVLVEGIRDEQIPIKMINNFVVTSAATFSLLVSDNQMQGTCFLCLSLRGASLTLVDNLELKRRESEIKIDLVHKHSVH